MESARPNRISILLLLMMDRCFAALERALRPAPAPIPAPAASRARAAAKSN